MRIIRLLAILLLIAVAIATILSLLMPVNQHMERSIVIRAKPAVIYDYLSKLSNFNKWAVWNKGDSTISNTITGTDGTLGAYNSWSGDPEISGQGKITITSLEINQEIEHQVSFLKPRKMDAASEFDLHENNGETTVIWTFEIATPRPWNIFNLFSSNERELAKDFEDGLRNLKAQIEKTTTSDMTIDYDVVPLTFPTTSFAIHRAQVNMKEISNFYATNLPGIYQAVANTNATPGSPTGLFYAWDEVSQQTDMAAAIAVPQGTKLEGDSIQVIEITGSKAVYVDYYGAYDKSFNAYTSIDKYLANNKLKQKSPVIEQYLNDPTVVRDTAKWLTRIIFLVE